MHALIKDVVSILHTYCQRSNAGDALTSKQRILLLHKTAQIEDYIEIGTFQELAEFKSRTRTINFKQLGDSFSHQLPCVMHSLMIAHLKKIMIAFLGTYDNKK